MGLMKAALGAAGGVLAGFELNIVWTGYGMVRHSMDARMDRAIAVETLCRMRGRSRTRRPACAKRAAIALTPLA